MNRTEKIAIIGGGMSGLAAAIRLAEAGKQVVLYERQDRIGKKLLLTGNGRCNLSNTDMDVRYYRTEDPAQLTKILAACDAEAERAFWEGLGMEIREMKGGLYPVTNQASTALDCLRFRIEELVVTVHTESFVEQIRGTKGNFTVSGKTSEGRAFSESGFAAVLLSCGGLAGVYKEAEQNGYAIAKSLRHDIRKGHPALVPVTCAEDMKAIAGVRVQARVTLLSKAPEGHARNMSRPEDAFSDEGELQLNKDGISGIPVFQLTRYLDDIRDAAFEIDFLPHLDENTMRQNLHERRERMRERTMEQFFAGWLQKKLTLYLLKRYGIKAEARVEAIPEKQLYRLLSDIKHCRFTPISLGDYRQAQVSVGGIPLSEVTEYMESRKLPGLYITGEMLDVTGACGGYNLHFALASAYAATEGILAGHRFPA